MVRQVLPLLSYQLIREDVQIKGFIAFADGNCLNMAAHCDKPKLENSSSVARQDTESTRSKDPHHLQGREFPGDEYMNKY